MLKKTNPGRVLIYSKKKYKEDFKFLSDLLGWTVRAVPLPKMSLLALLSLTVINSFTKSVLIELVSLPGAEQRKHPQNQRDPYMFIRILRIREF